MNNNDYYTLTDVCAFFLDSTHIDYKNQKDRMRQYFVDFLVRLNIPVNCFKDEKDQWRFNEDGRKLFIDFIENKSDLDSVYRLLREGKYHKIDDSKKLEEIINQICSNLTYNRNHSNDPEIYPSSEDVNSFYWNIVNSNPNQDPLEYPGVSSLLELIKTQKKLTSDVKDKIRRMDPLDLQYFDGQMAEELKEIIEKQNILVHKWITVISRFCEERQAEYELNKDCLSSAEKEKLFAMINGLISLIIDDNLSTLRKKNLGEEVKKEIIYFFIENNNIVEELEAKLKSRRLTNEEIYNKIAKDIVDLKKIGNL